ncbi:TPA: hypothetical protein QCX88_004816 [Bacillus wiedmannii]|nr:hypothetical protein [Bacillus wiedmannii]
MQNNYYVYEYYALQDGTVEFNEEIFSLRHGDVYYVGKGTGNRLSTGIRNMKCESFKKALGFGYRIIRDDLTEEDALEYERKIVQDYKEKGMLLIN